MFFACIHNDLSKLRKTVDVALAPVEGRIAKRVTLTGARAPVEIKECKATVLIETTKNRCFRKADPRHGHVQVA